MHINEVIEGLKQGKAFVREDKTCKERLEPAGFDQFRHSVFGENEQGGWGGINVMLISDLPGRFDIEGWEPAPRPKPRRSS